MENFKGIYLAACIEAGKVRLKSKDECQGGSNVHDVIEVWLRIIHECDDFKSIIL